MASSEFQQQLLADGMPNRATQIITTGVAKRIKEYRESNMHKTVIGRAVYNGKSAIHVLFIRGQV